ncbi:MAG TPA: phosphotransferase [Moraxellaceae bacterium]|nr:phosphotransferase [Moraxellaceae bacterium]
MGDVDLRRQQLGDWAVAWLARERPELQPAGDLVTVSGDASFRRYFRQPLTSGSLIAVDAPPDKENSRPFVAIARALRAHGVHVPEVVTADFDLGFMLLEDFGDVLLRPQLTPSTVDGLYGRAMDALLHLLGCDDVHGYTLPPYDRQRLIDEMSLIRDWFISRYLGLSLGTEQHAVLANAFDLIADDCVTQPQVFVHRDYHSRNLMLLANGEIGVIDFQDAVTGPVTYDLVSLLRDAYVTWPEADVARWVRQFAQQLRREHRLPSSVDDATFQRWFDWMGAQRHLKVVGIFARLSLRDGKHGYLDDIPVVFNYLLAEIRQQSQLQPLYHLLKDTVLPAYLAKKPEAAAVLGHWVG